MTPGTRVRTVVLLGPQRLVPTLNVAVDAHLGRGARLAAVTAGWEEREGEDEELRDHLGGRVHNLGVYERGEDVFRRDPDLFRAMQRRYDRLRRIQDVYRMRLAHALDAFRELFAYDPLAPDGRERRWLAAERADALEAVRTLDEQHVRNVAEAHAEFDAEVRPHEHGAIARHREELASELEGVEAVCVAGGHVSILLNRMRMFDVHELIGERALFCWSAGAMAMSERIVVFHDSPPQGAGNAEVLEAGLGAFPGVVALPHAHRRLRLDDPARVGLLSRRLAPALCVALDARCRIEWDGEHWAAAAGTQRLTDDGALAEIGGS